MEKLPVDPEQNEGCPFCGGPVVRWDTGFGVVQVIECESCHVRFVFPYSKAGPELLELWNKRNHKNGGIQNV